VFEGIRKMSSPRRGSLRVVLSAAWALICLACAAPGGWRGGVDRNAIDRVLDAAPMDQVHFGVYARDARSGRVLYSRNAHRKFVPASNQKILATAAAIYLLGPDYRFETALWATGPVEDGVLDGDLVLVGTGDPTLSRRYWDSGEAAMEALADSLLRAGIHQVRGALVADVSAWDSTTVGPTWEVEDLRSSYAATGGAFALEQGELVLVITGGGSPGEEADVSWSPRGDSDYVTPRVVTWPADSTTRARASYLPESRRLLVQGRIAVGVVDTVSVALRDPVRQAVATLSRVLAENEIEVEGGATVAWETGALLGTDCRSGAVRRCPAAAPVAVLASPPMSEIIAGILEPSQNWMTEQLVRTLGAELGEEGSWSAGTEVVTRFLVEDVGVDSLDVAPRDGSGLSAYNLVTPRALVRILEHMASGPHAAIYRSAMAEPGEEGSTLSRRLEGLEGRVFAKTGTISNVNSLSGYLVREDGREVVFSVLSNGSGLPSSRVRAAIDDVVRILAGQSP
jgi:D-alanyl-D-alanine carboxypeptidase/D-alanyl-D-alanine-endopeptidase (penicillin-binding protein 4)